MQPNDMVDHTVSDSVSDAPPQEDRMSKTNRKKPTAEARRRKVVARPARFSGRASKPAELKRTIAFRLSFKEERALTAYVRQVGNKSLAMRSMLITHVLIAQDRLVQASFLGGFVAKESPNVPGQWCVEANGQLAVDDLPKADAIMRAEWLSLFQAPAEKEKKELKETVAFRLSDKERDALKRFAKTNDVSVSRALRSFVITHIIRHADHLVEAVYVGGYRAHPQPNAAPKWCVASSVATAACELTRQEALLQAAIISVGAAA